MAPAPSSDGLLAAGDHPVEQAFATQLSGDVEVGLDCFGEGRLTIATQSVFPPVERVAPAKQPFRFS